MAPVQFGCGSCMDERFERSWFSAPTVPLAKGFSVHLSTVYGDDTVPVLVSIVPTVPVQISVLGKTVLTLLVSGLVSCTILEEEPERSNT